jgi:TPR repeat protein
MATFAELLFHRGGAAIGLGGLALAGCAFGMSIEGYAELPLCSRLGAWAQACGRCLEGDGDACMRVSEAHRSGRDARIGERTSELFAAQACHAGNPEGCVVAGVTLARDSRAFDHREAIQRRYTQTCEVAIGACERGHQGMCVMAGGCLLDSDRKQAQGLFESLCRDGSARACTLAGDHADKPPIAAAMYERGCALGSQDGCVGAAAAERLGFGVPVDPGDAQAKFQGACGDTSTFTACKAAEGYLPVTWLGRARLRSGLGTTGLPAPDPERLAELRWELEDLDRTAVAGFCLGDDGRAQDVRLLQTWGDSRVDAVVLDAVREGRFGEQTGVGHRCWWMTVRVKYR